MRFRLTIEWTEAHQYDSAAIEHAQEYVSRLEPIYPLGPVIGRTFTLLAVHLDGQPAMEIKRCGS